MMRYLLLSVVLTAAGYALPPSQPAEGSTAYLSQYSSVPAASPQWSPTTGNSQWSSGWLTSFDEDGVGAPADEVCYKIRAYLFKRDDDHAPEFVGSTTCSPKQPRAKEVVWPKARLLPAN